MTVYNKSKLSESNDEQSLDKRAYKLARKLFNKNDDMNLDTLLDVVQSMYFEIKQTNLKSNGYEYFCKRIEKSLDMISYSRVNVDDFVQLKLLGQGGFGKVSLVRHKFTNKVYAMKIMNKSLLLRSNQSAFFLEERQIMALSNSPWLVKLHYAFMDKQDIYMIMDFMQGGDLINLISNYDMPLEWIQFYAAEACIALNALHEYGFIHLDVKPDNMLLGNDGHLKLCDFGTCVNVQNSDGFFTCNFAVGTPDYISPEMLSSHNKPARITRATDWWSYGVFLYELLFEETPFSSDSLVGTYTKIANYESSLKFPNMTSSLKPACNLISKLLVPADGRYGFDDLKNDLFFKNTNWNFDNIIDNMPPYIPEIQDDTDTNNFDVSDSTEVSNVYSLKSTPFSGMGGDHLNFVGFSYNPSFDGLNFGLPTESTTKEIMPKNKKSITDDVIETELNEFKEKLATYQKLLCDIETQNKSLSHGKNSLNVQLQNVSLQLKQESDRNKELQSKLQDQLEKDNSRDAKTKEYLTKIVHLTAEIDNEKEKCRQLENDQIQFQLQSSEYEENSMTLRKNYGGVEKELKDLHSKYEKSLEEIDRLTSQLMLEKRQYNCLRSITAGVDNNLDSNATAQPPRLSLANELNVPAVKNRTAILMNSSSRDDEMTNSELSVDKVFMKTELQNLKDIINQNTENECKIKNDLRIITKENNCLKQQLESIYANIKNNPEFMELEHKCNSYECCMNLYKKQVKEMSSRLEMLKKESHELNDKLEKEIFKNNELNTEMNSLKNHHSNEMKKNKELVEQMELDRTNYTFEITGVKNEHDATLHELETIRNNLFISENKVIDLTKKLADTSFANESNVDSVSNNKENRAEPHEDDESLKWKNLYLSEKIKKDQAIKKLDETIHLMNQKGKIRKQPPNNISAVSDSKAVKKLQMELRNEKIRYEKLSVEKQSVIFEYNETIGQLRDKIKKLKDEKCQLTNYIQSAGLKTRTSLLSCSTTNPTPHKSKAHPLSNSNVIIERSSTHNSFNDLASDLHSDTDPFYSAQSATTEDSTIASIKRYPSGSTKSNSHFEGYLYLIPHNKMKRSSRKIPWKKYYGVLTFTHFIIYTEKVDKESIKKQFKKISIYHIQKAFQIAYTDLRKADPKDIPKIFNLRYYDEDLAGVATALTSNTTNLCNDNKNNSLLNTTINTTPEPVKEFRGHNLVLGNIDNHPFCGCCSMNLSENINGVKLFRCYECKLCNLKFHTYHMHLDDNCVSFCSKASSKIYQLNQSNGINHNFIIDMFLMAPSNEDRAKWIYAINNLPKTSKTRNKHNLSISSDMLTKSPSNTFQSKFSEKNDINNKQSYLSKGKGSSAS